VLKGDVASAVQLVETTSRFLNDLAAPATAQGREKRRERWGETVRDREGETVSKRNRSQQAIKLMASLVRGRGERGQGERVRERVWSVRERERETNGERVRETKGERVRETKERGLGRARVRVTKG